MALLVVGLGAVWMTSGFTPDGGKTGLNFADASTGLQTGSTVSKGSKGDPYASNGNTSNGSGTTSAADGDDEVTQTKFGPLTAADRDFLVRVRLAGSWEGPAGRKAQEKAGSPKVKDVGLNLIADHAQLDAKVKSIAAQLGVELPTEPNADQKKWLGEMDDAAPGSDFDQVFVSRLRAAHGKVFAVVAGIRAGTRNGMIRAFAQTANQVVMKHMTILEGTGLVRFSELPPPPKPTTAPPAGSTVYGNSPGGGPAGDQSQNKAYTKPIADATAKRRAQRGMDNYIIVLMLGAAGAISAVAYRQLHRRR
jgi:predicted outer membrane protein